MIPIELPELEKTLVTLAVDLLRAPQEHPDLVVSEPDAQGEVTRNAVRVTLHYFTALLAYGFPVGYAAVRQAADWFSTPFPTNQHSRIEMIEMSRLEALLSISPKRELVTVRLRQLVDQSTSEGQFDLQSENPYFDTLWSLKVLNMARKTGVLDDLISPSRLKSLVDAHLPLSFADKDLALALNLRFELYGGLTNAQNKRYLQKLLGNWQNNGGLWDVPRDMAWIPENLRKQQLSAGEIRANRDAFRKMILSTCYVIENLAPLAEQFPEVTPALRGAVELWWSVFYQNPSETLRELFPKPYDRIMMLARTLIMLRALFNEPLIEWGATHIYEELVAQHGIAEETEQRRNLRHVLQRLIAVDIEGEPDSLRLGLSESNVVRVRPHVQSLYDETRMSFAETLIVKYGPKVSIQAERESFTKLPDSIRDCFVRIPQDTYADSESGLSYVAMPDLHEHSTLYENIRSVAQIQPALMNELPPFLIHMHRGSDWSPVSASRGIVGDLYLLPMQFHIANIFKYLWEMEGFVLPDEAERSAAQALQQRLTERCADLTMHQFALEKFPKAYMHGDLHSRNIMIRRNTRLANGGNELDFKLIDLENLIPKATRRWIWANCWSILTCCWSNSRSAMTGSTRWRCWNAL